MAEVMGMDICSSAIHKAQEAVSEAEKAFIQGEIKSWRHMDHTPNQLRLAFWLVIADFYNFEIKPKPTSEASE